MSKFVPNSFQLPNALIDEVMAELSPVAFCVLCIIVRKTKGWGKESDAISLSQFTKLTNKSRNTIISALKEVENLEFITVKKTENKTSIYCFGWFNNCTSSKNALVQKMNQCSSEIEPETSSKIEHTKDQYKNTYQNTNNTVPESRSKARKNTKTKPQSFKDFFEAYPPNKKGGSDKTAWKKAQREKLTDEDFQLMLEDVLKRTELMPSWYAKYALRITGYIEEKIWLTPITPEVQHGTRQSNHSQDPFANTRREREQRRGITDDRDESSIVSTQ
ncbi:MAG: replication protein [Pseudomonadota bacterium]|nr:replication protein [Pseudomonadota bacterium]